MILDPSGIMKMSGIANNAARVKISEAEKSLQVQQPEKHLLLFRSGGNALKAVPLEHVSRLEEIDVADTEWAGKQRVIQYGDSLMPLYILREDQELPATGRFPVIVFSTRGGLAGLVVDEILDITAFRGEYQIRSGDGALEGSAIIQGQTTDIIRLGHRTQKNGHDEPANQPPEFASIIQDGHAHKRAVQ